MRSTRLFILVLLSLSLPVAAQDKPPTTEQALEFARAWLDAQRAYEEIPGMSVAVVHDQKLLWSGGSGQANPGIAKPATADTLYSICSVSKLFTSVAVMQLRDQGKLALDDAVSKHLAWFTMKPAEEGREVTVRGILTHSSGLPRESDFPYWTGEFDFPTREKVMERLPAQEPLYPSDRYFQYSNLGLTLAGEIVAAASGQPYDQYVRDHVLEPLDLDSTFTEIPLAEKGKRLAQGFSARDRNGQRVALPLFQTRGIAPAAGFASTVNDLARFASWQFRVLSSRSDPVLDPRTLREMYRAHWADPDLETFWGLGFATWKADGKVFVGHGGSCPGFRTHLQLDPEKKIGVVVMANASGVNLGRYAKTIYDIVSPTLKSEPLGVGASSPAEPSVSLGDQTRGETPREAGQRPALLAPYVGSFDIFPWDGETIFFLWGDQLGAVDLPTTEPLKEMEKLRKVGEHRFRRVRKDGSLGETIVFEIGPTGRASRVWWNSNPYPRMK